MNSYKWKRLHHYECSMCGFIHTFTTEPSWIEMVCAACDTVFTLADNEIEIYE